MGRGRVARNRGNKQRGHSRKGQKAPPSYTREDALKVLVKKYGPHFSDSGAPRYTADQWVWAFGVMAKKKRGKGNDDATNVASGKDSNPDRRQGDGVKTGDNAVEGQKVPVRGQGGTS